jgi:hypothetical protein
MDNSSKKRPQAGDETYIDTNSETPAHPAKKAKVFKASALTKTPIRRSGKII